MYLICNIIFITTREKKQKFENKKLIKIRFSYLGELIKLIFGGRNCKGEGSIKSIKVIQKQSIFKKNLWNAQHFLIISFKFIKGTIPFDFNFLINSQHKNALIKKNIFILTNPILKKNKKYFCKKNTRI